MEAAALALLGMVGLLLLVGCANLANLLMARSVNRSRELSIRLVLGAGRWRVIRLLLAESLVVACGGTALGLFLAPVLTRALLRLMPQSAIGGWLTSGLNLPLLGFCALLMLAATLLFGLLPAVHIARLGSAALAERTQTSAGSAIHGRSRKVLVAGQLALSLVLLAVAGLFGRSLANLMTRSPGFRTAHLLVFNVDPGLGGYTVGRGLDLYHELLHRLSNLPGVESASLSEYGILAHSEATTNVSVEGFRPNADEDAMCDLNAIGSGFFRTLGTPLLAGREFDERDQIHGASKVAIVNQAFVRHFLGGRKAVGSRMAQGAGGPLDIQIVGVAADVKSLSLRDPVKPTYYVPYEPSVADAQRIRQASFFVRANSGFDSLPGAVRATLAQLDRALPVFELRPMELQVEDSVYTERLIAALSSAFGLLALILTAVGLYGVIAYMVTRRTAEIGIRMALGATRPDILALVMREVVLLTAAGTVAGMLGAIAAGRVIQTLLFGVRGVDWAVFTVAPLVLAAVALFAGLLPALRASRIEPLEALRHD